MSLAISSNQHHTHRHTHTHLQSRDAWQPEGGAASCQAPQPPPHRSSWIPHQPLSQPPRHLSTTSLLDACCRVPQRGSLCAEKDAFLHRRAIVERILSQPQPHPHPQTQISCTLLQRELLMIVLLLFLQKQNLATAIYLFGLGTLLSGPGLKHMR